MKRITDVAAPENRPVRALQFGEGGFLRAFADEMLDAANEAGIFDGSVAIVKPRRGGALEAFREQKCLYTIVFRGFHDGRAAESSRIVRSVSRALHAYDDYDEMCNIMKEESLRFVISNTTEAGIVFDAGDRFDMTPPESFPGKLAKLLYLRWRAFDGARESGLIMLPSELIDKNGARLRECVLQTAENWRLEPDFLRWLSEDNIFCDTLVDRIVTGFPKEDSGEIFGRLGYSDRLLDVAEPFGLWVIASDRLDEVRRELPLDKAGLSVVFARDAAPYRERKVRILNGAHTSAALAAYLAGLDTIGECMNDPMMRKYIEKTVFDEIVPYVPLPREETEAFARSVLERFENPFLRHSLLSISLNSVSKWRERVLPSVTDNIKAGRLPELLTFSFAALAAFYTQGERDGIVYEIKDGASELEFFKRHKGLDAESLIKKLAEEKRFWGEDLGELPGFTDKAAGWLREIREDGARAAIERAVKI